MLATISVPKAEELVASPYRHGTKQKAEEFFLDGMTQAMHKLAVQGHPAAPITIYYAFKVYNTEGDSGASKVLAGVAAKAEAARQLAYRLYTLSERANRAEDARAYNEVVTGWRSIEGAAAKLPSPTQGKLFNDEPGKNARCRFHQGECVDENND